jgi:probable rRNA maturation factor
VVTNPHRVEVHIEGKWPVDAETLRLAALAVLVEQRAEAAEVAVVVSDDSTLRELNQRYRRIDASTDVLAFANDTRGPFASVGAEPSYLGDVIISYPRAVEQAAAAGHAVMAEVQLLVVHGMLHLLGHDDQAQPDRARMWAAQEAILGALGVEVNLPD